MGGKTRSKFLRIRIRTVSGDEIELEGDREAVEKNLAKLNPLLTKPSTKALEVAQVGIRKPPSEEEGLAKGLIDFYAEKRPETHFEKVLVIGYYLENSENKGEFAGKDILRGYSKVRERTPRNLSDTLSKAYRRSNYLLPGSKKGLWRLSNKGVKIVRGLPVKRKSE